MWPDLVLPGSAAAMLFSRSVKETTLDQAPPTFFDTSAVIELRQYTLHPGKRDALIDLFDRNFVEGQEATGMRVLGQFRDRDDANRFVWLRGFRDMPSRAQALGSFYGGPVWKANRAAANATMIDSDDVLLLRPVDGRSGFALPGERPSLTAPDAASSLVVATIYLLSAPVDDEFIRFFESRVTPLMAEAGAPVIARFQTEYAQNTFAALPVREGEHAFVWFSSFATAADYDRHLAKLRESSSWSEVVQPKLARLLKSPAQVRRLGPTARSLLRHPAPAPSSPERTGDVHDFDFLAGDWNIANRRLKARGVGSDEWDSFPAKSHAVLHLGGVANVEEITFLHQVSSGMTVRAFDLEKRRWSIYWISSKSGTLFPPVVGGFTGDRGEFYGEDRDGGYPVKVRFTWTKLGSNAARWEQAFSADGRAWETNWIMELTRG
jgi:NIPSNAP